VKVEFTVPGKIKPWSRPRFDSRHMRVFNDSELEASKGMIGHFAHTAMKNERPIVGAVKLWVEVFTHQPKSWSNKKKLATKYVTSKPDADRLYNTVADALKGIAYLDDAQIADVRLVKAYTDGQEQVHVLVESLDGIL
jgi:Holliday junction resolvase RusA-like endonuclease